MTIRNLSIPSPVVPSLWRPPERSAEVCAGWEAAVVALEAHFGSVFKQVGDELVEFRWQVLDADFAQLRDVVEADMAG